jgi:hypothetical protein
MINGGIISRRRLDIIGKNTMKKFNVDRVDRGIGWENNTRRVEVQCHFCKKLTKQVTQVCPTCQYRMEVGRRYLDHLEKESSGEEVIQMILPRYLRIGGEAAMTQAEYLAKYQDSSPRLDPQDELTAALLQLAPITPTVPTVTPMPVLSRYTFGADMTEGRTYIGTKYTAQQLEKVVELIRLAIKEAQAEGYKKGSNILEKLANGELTINDLNDKEARRR